MANKKLNPDHDPKEIIESGLSTGKRTQYAGPGTDTVMPQVTAIECAAVPYDRPETGIRVGLPPRPGLQWKQSSHRWVKPSVTVGGMSQNLGVQFKPAAQTAHTYSAGAGVMPVRGDASERTKFHALFHVLDADHSISRLLDADDEELRVERDKLGAEIRSQGENVDPMSAEEQLAEAFGRWMTDPEFEETFPAMVEFMHEHLVEVLDLEKAMALEPATVTRGGQTFASHRWRAADVDLGVGNKGDMPIKEIPSDIYDKQTEAYNQVWDALPPHTPMSRENARKVLASPEIRRQADLLLYHVNTKPALAYKQEEEATLSIKDLIGVPAHVLWAAVCRDNKESNTTAAADFVNFLQGYVDVANHEVRVDDAEVDYMNDLTKHYLGRYMANQDYYFAQMKGWHQADVEHRPEQRKVDRWGKAFIRVMKALKKIQRDTETAKTRVDKLMALEKLVSFHHQVEPTALPQIFGMSSSVSINRQVVMPLLDSLRDLDYQWGHRRGEDVEKERIIFDYDLIKDGQILKEAMPLPVFPRQPENAQMGKPAGYVLPVPEVRAETKQKRPQIAPPVEQLKRIK